MEIRAKYSKGVFKPLEKVKGIYDGEEVEIVILDEAGIIAESGGSFDFLREEKDLYTEKDIKERF